MLSLSRDAAAINAVINHPAVRPFIGAPEVGALDIAPILARPENLFPFGEYGGFALVWSAPATREVHTYILPEGRGKWARDAAREMIGIAAEHGTNKLWTKIHPDMANVRIYATRAGMKATGEVIETLGEPYAVYSMEVH